MKIKSQNDNNNNNIITNDKPIVLCKRVFEKTQDKKELNLISKMIHNNTNKHSNHKLSQLTLNSKKHFYDLNTKCTIRIFSTSITSSYTPLDTTFVPWELMDQ